MNMEIIQAIIFGGAFGFVLHLIGASNPQLIINMLRLKDLYLMKVILLGIGLSSLLAFLAFATNLLPADHFSIKGNYVGVFVGGILLGAGWGISGFCPGTGIVACGALRKDALAFVFGGLGGALLYMFVYASIKDSFLFTKLGSVATIASTGNTKYPALLEIPGVFVAGPIGILFVVIALLLPNSLRN